MRQGRRETDSTAGAIRLRRAEVLGRYGRLVTPGFGDRCLACRLFVGAGRGPCPGAAFRDPRRDACMNWTDPVTGRWPYEALAARIAEAIATAA